MTKYIRLLVDACSDDGQNKPGLSSIQWRRWLLLTAVIFLALSALLPVVMAKSELGAAERVNMTTATAVSQPYLVADINQTQLGADPYDYVRVGGQIFFSAADDDHGRELWVSDGTITGTQMVKDIKPGLDDGSVSPLTALNGQLLFTANDGISGSELWLSDGSEGGTILLKDINPGSSVSWIRYVTVFGNTAFFQADDGVNGAELWKTDGTITGTVMVADINPGSADSAPRNFVRMGGYVYFSANDGAHGAELWRTDGTAAG
ncbi:MAG TPA: hypothetical protein ENK32_08560, partial [Anaerolineae bacterium]|nr:hypothetical protein [Anaerolineae bacterium]